VATIHRCATGQCKQQSNSNKIGQFAFHDRGSFLPKDYAIPLVVSTQKLGSYERRCLGYIHDTIAEGINDG
jgi:hypothetical protein